RETLSRLSAAKYFTKLDIRNAYSLIRMKKGEEWKTAFHTRYGLYQYNVMPFSLCNAPATFQAYINEALKEFLDVFCTAYLDDVLIYSNSFDEHIEHVTKVHERLTEFKLQCKPQKCEFHIQSTGYLGVVISIDGVGMDPKKIESIVAWPIPHVVKDVKSFLGFSGYYRRFIRDYSKVTMPLNHLTKKAVPFVWDTSQDTAFTTLKEAFTSAPILQHFDYEREIVVETDASDFVSAGVLSQPDDASILHPVGFFSKKHSPAECKYEIYDKELLAIVCTFEEWRPELEGAKSTIKVLTDHR